MRHLATSATRASLAEQGFVEIETPMLTRQTPEGARDYLVPSRTHNRQFYALPQSPQLYKQLLICGGFDRYFQIAKCLRDEDLRADRQPEFTQLDMELAFVDEDDIRELIDRLLSRLFQELLGVEIELPIQRMEYQEAMARYGSDRPDTRFELFIHDVSEEAGSTDFQVFSKAVESGGVVRGIRVPGGATLSRKDIDGCESIAKSFGAKGLAWTKLEAEGAKGPIAKFLGEEGEAALRKAFGAGEGDLLLLVADKESVADVLAVTAVRPQRGDDRDPFFGTRFPCGRFLLVAATGAHQRPGQGRGSGGFQKLAAGFGDAGVRHDQLLQKVDRRVGR